MVKNRSIDVLAYMDNSWNNGKIADAIDAYPGIDLNVRNDYDTSGLGKADVVMVRHDYPVDQEFLEKLREYDTGTRLFINPPEVLGNGKYTPNYSNNGKDSKQVVMVFYVPIILGDLNGNEQETLDKVSSYLRENRIPMAGVDIGQNGKVGNIDVYNPRLIIPGNNGGIERLIHGINDYFSMPGIEPERGINYSVGDIDIVDGGLERVVSRMPTGSYAA